MAMPGYQPENLFAGMCNSCVSTDYNVNESHNQYLQGWTMAVLLPILQAMFSPLVLTQLDWVGGLEFRWGQVNFEHKLYLHINHVAQQVGDS
jgi:hypothetical protein